MADPALKPRDAPATDRPGREADAPRHWRLVRDGDEVAWLTLDRADRSVNTLSAEVLEELNAVLDALERDPPRGLVIRSGKARGFVYGADVAEFADIADAESAAEHIRAAHAVMDRLERLRCPSVAAIHGACLGGGLELALACTARLARDDAELGFPEVRLGIHPGFGGTARATRLIPAPAALRLMLTGRTVSARAAKGMGLVDATAPERHMDTAARLLLRTPPRHRKGHVAVRLANAAPVRPVVATLARRAAAAQARPEHYPAPFALIDLWRRHGGRKADMLAGEAESVARLIGGGTSRNLQHLFALRRRLKALSRTDAAPVRHVHVIGAGAMGGDIAAWCAIKGHRVSLQDRTAADLGPALTRARSTARRELRESVRVQAALDRLIPDLRGDGLRAADLVIEAIPEKLEAKRALFAEVEGRLRADAVLASNTSSIPLERLAEGLDRPERLVGLHFFNPVARMPLVEVVHADTSGQAALDRALALVGGLDRLPLPVASAPGFLVNRALAPYMLEAVRLLDDGQAPEWIDAAAEAFGMPMGPLELADRVGLDVCADVARMLRDTLGQDVPDRLDALVAGGRTGRKAGHGVYRYKAGKPRKRCVRGRPDAEVQDRLILPLLNAALACLREGVVDDADLLDAGLVFGAGFAPFRGGPMRYIRDAGAETLRGRLARLAEAHGPRFEPDAGWSRLAADEAVERS